MPPRPDAPGAIPLVLHAQLAGLRQRHDVTLITVAGDEPAEFEAADDLKRSGVDVHVVDARRPRGAARWRRRWRFASTWARGSYPWRTVWFADPRVQHTVDSLVRTRSFDVISVEDNAMAVFRLPPNLPAVLSEHEVRRPRKIDWHPGPLREMPYRAFREADWRRWPAYQRAVWRRFDRIQVFSERDAHSFGLIAPDLRERVRVTPFGVEIPERSDPALEEPGRILFVGNFAHPPNVDAALWLAREVMPSLRAQRSGVRLQLVGPHPPEHVRGAAGPDVHVLGEVPDIRPYLDAAQVIVAPVRTGGGMRMKVLHALACGKAVVTTPRGAEGLAIGTQEAPVAVAEDADGIASTIAGLLQDEGLRRGLAERARSLAEENYSPEAYGRRLEAVYAEAIAERRGSGRAAWPT